ncbi:rhodanese-like domain-containing protein [Kangiella shandongensis]|uniref:rhodanese-like domain-containing protein n=1 Tax=Kangiella shandongensis TaxID=2763258 RepID=UPI001CC0A48C|nr:rhodanese-like domain-containing protein [Kangiella shandongensis]
MTDNLAPPIIDLRSYKDYVRGHLPGAVHIPFEQLPDLWHELPPKGSSIQLCVAADKRATAEELFHQRDFIITQLHDESQLAQAPLNTGDNKNRLWKGNPLLEQHTEFFTPAPDTTPVAVDIGCGSGRDSILLGMLGYRVIAIDVFDGALARVAHSAHRWQLKIETVEMNCRQQPDALIELLEQRQPQLVMQSRFLHRPLFDTYQKHLPVGCKVAIHTFLEGAAEYGNPKNPDFLLKNKELAERFADWSVLFNQVHRLDDGRPLSLFIAQKPKH